MPVWLLTGATGFLGRWVAQALTERRPPDVTVVTVGRRRPHQNPSLDFVACDLAEPEQVVEALRSIQPATIIHTAGHTPPAPAEQFYRGNTLATVHLLDAARALERPLRIVLTGSAAELGRVDARCLPVREDHPCFPEAPYGLSKWLTTAAGLAASAPLEVIVARVFNPIGPGTPTSHAFGRFASVLGSPSPDPLTLTVGDLEPRRDFVDVRDVAQALIALAERGHAGLIYNVGTGRSISVRTGLEHLISLSGRAVRIETDPALAARSGPPDSRAAIDRITSHTGWHPQIPWEQSLNDLWQTVRMPAGCH
jgi:GDP-4-dehydro-6-deoxy-D-mannose reductase